MALTKMVNGVSVPLTTEEETQVLAEWQTENDKLASMQWERDRKSAYEAKGWMDAFDVIDDMAVRGFDIVLADRSAIKTQFPKPV